MSKLTVDDIEVPKGMLDALLDVVGEFDNARWRQALAAALLWLAENPIVPSGEECHELMSKWCETGAGRTPVIFADLWQRRMFLRKQDALPDEVKKLMYQGGREPSVTHNEAVTAAYRLGKEGK